RLYNFDSLSYWRKCEQLSIEGVKEMDVSPFLKIGYSYRSSLHTDFSEFIIIGCNERFEMCRRTEVHVLSVCTAKKRKENLNSNREWHHNPASSYCTMLCRSTNSTGRIRSCPTPK